VAEFAGVVSFVNALFFAIDDSINQIAILGEVSN
jgi:hypothetical protein